jgi:transposase-like protein
MKRKTSEDKEKIIKEIEKLGVVEGRRKYGISASTYYDWDRKYKSNGFDLLLVGSCSLSISISII